MRTRPLCLTALIMIASTAALSQSKPQSDPQALAFAASAITALTGGTAISDVTLTGTASWSAGDDSESGAATLLALGAGESRFDVSLPDGTRTEIRDASTGNAEGKWITQTGASGLFAPHNCWTDPAWFFPALGSLSNGPNVVLSYIGQESRNGVAVQHIQSYSYQANQESGAGPSMQHISTIDFFLDATTFLPITILFNTHPDSDAGTDIPIEIDFLSYQTFGSAAVPVHIQRYLQGSLNTDVAIVGATFNTGLSLSNFTIQ